MRHLALLLVVSILLGLAGCGDRDLVTDELSSYDGSVPAVITLFSPADNYASANRRPEFSWRSFSPYAWRLLVSTNASFSSLMYDQTFPAATSGSWTPPADITNEMVYWKVIGTAGSVSNVSPVNTIRPPYGIRGLLITEWADAGTNLDYIELCNFGEETVTITTDLMLYYNSSLVSLVTWGTGTNLAAYTALGAGVPVAPDEAVIIVNSAVTAAALSNLQYWGLSAGCKVFRSSRATLIATGERLSAVQACLTNSDGKAAWSRTPDPAAFTASVGTSTYSALKAGFRLTADDTTATYWWGNGTGTTLGRTPGVWP